MALIGSTGWFASERAVTVLEVNFCAQLLGARPGFAGSNPQCKHCLKLKQPPLKGGDFNIGGPDRMVLAPLER